MAIGMTLVDSYRRRGKHRAVSFPTAPPSTVPVGDGEVTTYTFGPDLYDDMLAAIEGAAAPDPLRDLHLEGRRGRPAVQDRAGGRRRPRRRGLLHLRRASPTSSSRRGSSASRRRCKVLRYPVYAAGWRPSTCAATAATTARSSWSTTRSGSSAATTSATPTRPSGATPTSGSPGPACGTSSAPSPTSGTSTGAGGSGASERPLLLETASTWEPHDPVPPQRAAAVDVPDPRRCTSRRSTGPASNIWMTTAYFIPDQDFVDALTAAAAARGRRPAADPGQVQPRRRRLDLARLLRPAARRRGDGAALPRRDGARQDRHHRRHAGRRSAPRTSTGSA